MRFLKTALMVVFLRINNLLHVLITNNGDHDLSKAEITTIDDKSKNETSV